MKPHLYLLPFEDKKYFKFGISLTNNYNRILTHLKTYDVDYENIMIVESDDKSHIRLIERNINVMVEQILSEDFEYDGKDGHTEIRSINQWEKVMEVINMFKGELNLTIRENVDFINYEPIAVVKKSTKRKEKKKRRSQLQHENNLQQLDIIQYNFRLIEEHIHSFVKRPSVGDRQYIGALLSFSSLSDKEIVEFGDRILIPSFCFGNTKFSTTHEYSYDLKRKSGEIVFDRHFPRYDDVCLSKGYDDIATEYYRMVVDLVNGSIERSKQIYNPPHPYHLYKRSGGVY